MIKYSTARMFIYAGILLQAVNDSNQTVSEFLIVLLITLPLLATIDVLERWEQWAINAKEQRN